MQKRDDDRYELSGDNVTDTRSRVRLLATNRISDVSSGALKFFRGAVQSIQKELLVDDEFEDGDSDNVSDTSVSNIQDGRSGYIKNTSPRLHEGAKTYTSPKRWQTGSENLRTFIDDPDDIIFANTSSQSAEQHKYTSGGDVSPRVANRLSTDDVNRPSLSISVIQPSENRWQGEIPVMSLDDLVVHENDASINNNDVSSTNIISNMSDESTRLSIPVFQDTSYEFQQVCPSLSSVISKERRSASREYCEVSLTELDNERLEVEHSSSTEKAVHQMQLLESISNIETPLTSNVDCVQQSDDVVSTFEDISNSNMVKRVDSIHLTVHQKTDIDLHDGNGANSCLTQEGYDATLCPYNVLPDQQFECDVNIQNNVKDVTQIQLHNKSHYTDATIEDSTVWNTLSIVETDTIGNPTDDTAWASSEFNISGEHIILDQEGETVLSINDDVYRNNQLTSESNPVVEETVQDANEIIQLYNEPLTALSSPLSLETSSYEGRGIQIELDDDVRAYEDEVQSENESDGVYQNVQLLGENNRRLSLYSNDPQVRPTAECTAEHVTSDYGLPGTTYDSDGNDIQNKMRKSMKDRHIKRDPDRAVSQGAEMVHEELYVALNDMSMREASATRKLEEAIREAEIFKDQMDLYRESGQTYALQLEKERHEAQEKIKSLENNLRKKYSGEIDALETENQKLSARLDDTSTAERKERKRAELLALQLSEAESVRKQAEEVVMKTQEESQRVIEQTQKSLRSKLASETEKYRDQLQSELQSILSTKDNQLLAAKRELQQTEQLQKKAEKEALTAKAEAEELTELANEMEAQLRDIEMVHETNIAHIEANHAEKIEQWRRHAQSQQAAQMDVLSLEESMRSEIATIENDKKDAETRCQKLESDVSRWQQSYESIGAELASVYQELNNKHVSSQQNGANEAVLSVVQKELKEKTTCLANMKTQYNESIQLTKILQKESRMCKDEIDMLKKENLLVQENLNVAKETLTQLQNASNASNMSQGLTSSTSQSHNADNFGPLNVAGRQTQVERECELLRRRVDEKDRRIEQLIVEKNSLQIDLERLHQETAKHYDAEKGGVFSVFSTMMSTMGNRSDDEEGRNKFIHKIDQPLRSFYRLLYMNHPVRMLFSVYFLVLHMWAIIILHFSKE